MSEPKNKPDKSDASNQSGQSDQGSGQGQGRPGYEVLIYHEEKGQNPDRTTLREPDVQRKNDE